MCRNLFCIKLRTIVKLYENFPSYIKIERDISSIARCYIQQPMTKITLNDDGKNGHIREQM